MADNLTFQTSALATVPDATVVATDDAGAAGHVQVVKLAVSTNGSATPLTADNTDGLLVNLGANNDVTIGAALPAGTNAIGKLAANSGVDIGDVDVTSVPTSSAATTSSQNDQATSATLLASNASRKGFAVFNESTSYLYVKFGTTATATDYTVRIDPYGYFEHMGVGIYTGRVDGIWSADASGAARVTEW